MSAARTFLGLTRAKQLSKRPEREPDKFKMNAQRGVSLVAFARRAQTSAPATSRPPVRPVGDPGTRGSAYGPGAVYPPSPYREYHPGGYSSPPDYYDPYEYEPPRVYRQRRRPIEVDRRGPEAPSPQEVMAAIEAAKGGEGPLGPFLNDPTLRAGDVVVTTKGFMMFRGEESQSHRQTDFVSIAHASGLAANKKTLISLERASHLTPPKPFGAEARRMRNPAPEVASSASVKPPHAGR